MMVLSLLVLAGIDDIKMKLILVVNVMLGMTHWALMEIVVVIMVT